MSFLNNGYTGEQGASNMTMQSSSRDSSTQSSKRGKSGAGTYSGVTKNSRSNRNSPVLQSIASTQAVHQPDLWETINSIVIPKEVKAGDQGEKKKPRAKVRWEGTQMFGWVDGTWKPAAYHIAVRAKLILRDAEQPGAPFWEEGNSLDYTSYSPLTRGWTEDPRSIKDRQGRQVMMMPQPPKDWSSVSTTKPLTYGGLVILDINNRPIRDFPGAPTALASTEKPWFLEGLRRCFGMTVYDLRYRMIPVRNSPKGRMRLQGYTYFTNYLKSWRDSHNKKNVNEFVYVWQHRDKKKLISDDDVAQSSQEDEEDEGLEEDEEQEEELVLPTPFMPTSDAARDPIIYPYPSSSTVHMSTTPEQTSWEGNHLSIPTFPGANQFAQTTNTVPSDSIYTASYPLAFPPSNIYSSAGYPYDFASANRSSLNHRTNYIPITPGTFSGADIPAHTTNTVPSNSIGFTGYPLDFAPPPYIPASITSHNNYTSVAPDFGNSPPISSSVTATTYGDYTQPCFNILNNADDVWHDNSGLHRPEFPAHREPNPPITALQDTQPVATASSVPVLPEENAPIAISSPEEDPFMGADWSPEATGDWL